MKTKLIAALLLTALLCSFTHAAPLGSTFTYQGKLDDGGLAATGSYDFRFILHDAAVDGSQVGNILTAENLAVTNGLFTVSVDFGAVFDGSSRWIEIAVRPGASTGAFTVLNPRQPLTAAPYALYALTPAGPQGTEGAAGATGPAGPQGAKGDTGLTGNAGATGPQGIQGVAGAVGPLGPQGPIGLTGATGNTGPAGSAGPAGATGAIGPIGPEGLKWRGAWSVATVYAIDDAVAHNGSSWMAKVGSTASAPIEGSANWDLLSKKGDLGATGPQGPVGATGSTGPSGAQGPTGPTGATGATGTTGPQGIAGPQGPSGAFTLAGATASYVGGNVGIGTTNPLARLHVHEAGSPSAIIMSTGSGSQGPASLQIQADSGLIGHGQSLVIYDRNADQYRLVLNERGELRLGPSLQYSATSGEENLRIVRGSVHAEGSTFAGSGFVVNHIGTGRYLITFNTPFAGATTVTASPMGGPPGLATAGSNTGREFIVSMYNLAGDLADHSFHFIAIGPR